VYFDRFPPWRLKTGSSLPEWFLLFSTGFIRVESTNILLCKRDFFHPPEQRRKTVDMDWLALSELKSHEKNSGKQQEPPKKTTSGLLPPRWKTFESALWRSIEKPRREPRNHSGEILPVCCRHGGLWSNGPTASF
jgi:hypothetical protein